MLVSRSLGINDQGRLTVGGCDAVELCKEFGTPLYVMDENAIRHNCQAFRESIEKYYDGKGRCLFASKAFTCLAMAKIIRARGARHGCGIGWGAGYGNPRRGRSRASLLPWQ